MIKFRNRLTGTITWVADERKDEYLEAGYMLASSCAKPDIEPEEPKPLENPEEMEEKEPEKEPEKVTPIKEEPKPEPKTVKPSKLPSKKATKKKK